MTATALSDWQFANPTQVRFGPGCRATLVGLVARQRVLIVTTRRGRARFAADPLLAPVATASDVEWVDSITPNPGLAEVQAGIDRLSGRRFDAVVSFGGGSAMDAAKALAAALAPGATTRDLATLIREPARIAAPLPIFALPTTSGTGSEVTPFATIWDHAGRRKLSLAGPGLFPRIALVDPELTFGLPRAATVSTGLDALNQALESVWNRNRSEVTLLLAGRAVALAFDALPRLDTDTEDAVARVALAEASLLAGLCISQTRTAICHSISYPLTAHFGVPHGLACAFSMGAVARLCVEHAPKGLEQIAIVTGHGSPERLCVALESVLRLLRVAEITRAALPGASAVLALKHEMYTPGRSDNFILPVDDTLIAKVIEESMTADVLTQNG